MNGINRSDLDEVTAKAFKELQIAINSHSEKSVLMYSHALRALVQLRQQVIAEARYE